MARWRAAGRLVADTLVATAAVVGDVQGAVTGRVRSALPPVARPVVDLQSAAAGVVYSCIALGARAVPPLVVEALLLSGAADRDEVPGTGLARRVLAVVNGLWGDTVAERYPELAVRAAVRVDDRDVVPDDPGAVAAAFPGATARIVVFVHGLTLSDRSWRRAGPGAGPAPAGRYGDRLRADTGHTPVYLHYNSGLPVADNGRLLGDVLDGLVRCWPVRVEEVVLVGHSMGGLVARAMCGHGARAGLAWVPAVRAVVTLGTPHLGAPLEKSVHVAERLLARVPESEPLARVLATRSAGVRDLRLGADVPLPAHVRHHVVAATIGSGAGHPVGWLLGDGMVRRASAVGAGRSSVATGVLQLPGLHHFSLLNHPHVYEQLRAWLDVPPVQRVATARA